MKLSLRNACIVTSRQSGPLITLAVRELSNYLYQLSGIVSPIVQRSHASGTHITLRAKKPFFSPHFDSTFEQRYELRASDKSLLIIGETPLGVLYGVYDLLGRLGVGFYLGGDTFPDGKIDPLVPSDLLIRSEPCFAVRGSNLHGNIVIGSSGWGKDDWRFYLDQMARMRCNLFMFRNYNCEPAAGYEWQGEICDEGRPHSSLNPAFGINPMRTSDFAFGTEVYFDQELFGASPVNETTDLSEQILKMQGIIREAVRYGRQRGLHAALGFDVPSKVDPTDPLVRERFKARVRQFVHRYPDIAYFCLWQNESQGLNGEEIPNSSSAQELIRKHRDIFAYLGGERRIYAGIHFTEFSLMAYRILKEEAPTIRFAVCGWGGDRWMHFADYAKGLHQLLPPDIILTCHDNIDCTFSDSVSEAWGSLPSDRQRWAQPWIEMDGEEMWTRQANVEPLSRLLPDAHRKGCQGVLTLHWRTRDFEEELSYLARYSWQPDLTTEQFYQDSAERMFGEDQKEVMSEVLGDLQRLGGRWSGINGGWECGSDWVWTGRNPHWAYELDGEALELLRRRSVDAHTFFTEQGFQKAASEFARFAKQLEELGMVFLNSSLALSLDQREDCLSVLRVMEEDVFCVRTDLLATDVPPQAWPAVDNMMLPLHHLTHQSDHQKRTQQLKELRERVLQSRDEKESKNPGLRSERYDFLLGSLDMVLAFDRVSKTLATPGPVVEKLDLAKATSEAGNLIQSIDHAVEAYELAVDTCIQQVMKAQTHKLTTECEFGVLALINLEMVPGYWEMLQRIERYLPAIPPRELHLLMRDDSIRIHWKVSERAVGYNIYRGTCDESGSRDCVGSLPRKHLRRINREPVQSHNGLCAYVDRPTEAGVVEYRVTAINEKGWESPHSHAYRVSYGMEPVPPVIVGIKQGFCLTPNHPHEVSVLVLPVNGDALESVLLRYRLAGKGPWQQIPMLRRFRRSYHGLIPVVPLKAKAVEYYVEATTLSGQRSVWPTSSIAGRPWTTTVLPGIS